MNKLLRILKIPKLIKTLKMSKRFTLSNLLRTLHLGDLWRYRIKSSESLISTLYFAIMTYIVLHIGSCIFIYIGY